MTIPTFQELMLPLLQLLSDEKVHYTQDIVDKLSNMFNLTQDEIEELIPSGNKRFSNRVGWATTYLKKAKLITSSGRSQYKITERGKEVLLEQPGNIDMKYLQRFPEYLEFRNRKSKKVNNILESEDDDPTKTPEELMEISYQSIKEQLASEILELIIENSARFFEILVVDLLVAMGYGGNREDAGEAVGRVNDEGIDGIIKQDKLGLENIYIQAKKWKDSVGRPVVNEFAGSLMGKGANKGILITTSYFTKGANEYAEQLKNPKIILIDGQQLAEYMIDHNLGVTEINEYIIKRIDKDYFEEGL